MSWHGVVHLVYVCDVFLSVGKWRYVHTCKVALLFCTRMLWPRPRILPFLSTRQAPIGTPPSLKPFLASSSAALKPMSCSDAGGGECEDTGGAQGWFFVMALICKVV